MQPIHPKNNVEIYYIKFNKITGQDFMQSGHGTTSIDPSSNNEFANGGRTKKGSHNILRHMSNLLE